MSVIKKDTNYGYLNFFEITESGLYRTQKKTDGEIRSKSFGLDTTLVLRNIKAWVDSRRFKETSPWAELGESGDPSVMCYCKEIHEFENGDFLLTLWKHDPSDSKSYRGLRLNEKGEPIGFISNNSLDTGDDVVWGHPCYYWIIPKSNLVISIKFEDSKCDSDLMQKWINYCVRYRLKIDKFNKRQPGESATTIYFSSEAAPEDYSLLYRFSKKIKEFRTSEAYLKKICETTKHVLLRNEVIVSSEIVEQENKKSQKMMLTLDKANNEIFDFIEKIMGRFFGPGPDNAVSDDGKRRVEVKLEATPTYEQMQDFMKYSSDFPEDGWADVIFIDENENKTSIKKHRLVERVMLPKSGEIYSAALLYATIAGNRSNYLQSISNITKDAAATEEAEQSDAVLA
ncbi:TPA: hypothetical protein ACRNNC_006011 [Pseudomonas aeruginosa]|uniref:hypothetical protein n=1 Tax=Pseudomonas aeruginosa TaxID=287 RepID=UPI000F81D041|nr:hypothetical protein [Pseudomonas aeruginosa]MBG5839506.1 hypothetical protein [Pseudomonas aeruginosa]MBI7504488.1 hypothetical protein [Pseudomonas aeruginosa]MBI8276772.1 hypothetical protein [Pseudomonas aeruginosa]MBV5858380.1 hypothetical protein [Pseudomonas aeruginosa]MCS7643369.1 hypothetical protein [Pseudomonas aeruginosa]